MRPDSYELWWLENMCDCCEGSGYVVSFAIETGEPVDSVCPCCNGYGAYERGDDE